MKTQAVRGVKEGIANLKKSFDKLAVSTEKGLKNFGIDVFRESQTMVPVMSGKLKGSGSVIPEGNGFGTIVTIKYTAEYAIYVHENLDNAHGAFFNIVHASEIMRKGKTGEARIRWAKRRPKEQAKFLETAIRVKQGDFSKYVGKDININLTNSGND